MKRKGERSRPPIPEWVLDLRSWESHPDLSPGDRARAWSAARQEWLDFYGYDVFDENDALLEHRQHELSAL